MTITDMRAALAVGDEVSDVDVVIRYGQLQRATATATLAATARPTDPFEIANAAIFRAPGSLAAEYDDGAGDLIPIRIIRTTGTIDIVLPDMQVPTERNLVLIQRREIEKPAEGDRLFIGDDEFVVVGRPRLDLEGLNWLCELNPVG